MDTTGGRKENRSPGRCFGGLKETKAAGRVYGDTRRIERTAHLSSLFLHIDDAQHDAEELYFCLRKDRDVVWESIFDDDTAYRKLPHEILKERNLDGRSRRRDVRVRRPVLGEKIEVCRIQYL